MRFATIFPLAFCSLALAQALKARTDFIAAILYSGDDYEYDVKQGQCVNLKRSQPNFDQIEIGRGKACRLYPDLRCGNPKEYEAGEHEIADVQFKSIRCDAVPGAPWDEPRESL
ncbi:hypothetical protein ISF_07874 [Cordyceps fumosorosea ARSEF 2679]|uniref:Beta/gamma crystallin n=1 Tax=Cordyceps fumosorosea (strain ARSEF 2679) TaxID=1081104 RepID=A0A167NBP1_CORFA|nr:hypothetical protein ISF_07874 [Cordyceps fumosorosea ARSEF 2679]OAA55363.1 hypothetical protein ISF_07874 [Cordyceps fumosorosea ARSEF 2679]